VSHIDINYKVAAMFAVSKDEILSIENEEVYFSH
jgi:hypothetical protein